MHPPSPLRTAGEVMAGREPFRLAWHSPGMRHLPRGDGAPVVLVPGLGATDVSMLPLRNFLRHLGHDARSSGLGRMTRDVPGTYLRLTERVLALVTATGRVPALVGWSIGGVVSRETAREHPEAVRRVITFGTPVTGGPASSVVGRRYSAEFLAQVRAAVDERNRIPIDVPITAMWSRRDGIVAPEACIDHLSANVEHIEVSSTHLGMGLDPDVWAVIARRLVA